MLPVRNSHYLSEDEYSKLGNDYFCSDCSDKRIMQIAKRTESKGAARRYLVPGNVTGLSAAPLLALSSDRNYSYKKHEEAQ